MDSHLLAAKVGKKYVFDSADSETFGFLAVMSVLHGLKRWGLVRTMFISVLPKLVEIVIVFVDCGWGIITDVRCFKCKGELVVAMNWSFSELSTLTNCPRIPKNLSTIFPCNFKFLL